MPPLVRPQLLALDLDGTVVDSANEFPVETLQVLRDCHAAGIKLAFLTGRRPVSTAPHLDALGLPCRVATNSGALRWDYPGWHLAGSRFFEAGLLTQVAELLEPYSANFYVNSLAEGFEYYALERQSTPEIEEYQRRYGFRNYRRIKSMAEIDSVEITQVAMPGPDDVVKNLRDRINAQFDGRITAMAVRWPILRVLALELFHPRANKGDALAQFAAEAGIEQARTLAAGDDVNDLAMLKWAGHGVAMPGANGEVVKVSHEQLTGDGAHALAPYLRELLELPDDR